MKQNVWLGVAADDREARGAPPGRDRHDPARYTRILPWKLCRDYYDKLMSRVRQNCDLHAGHPTTDRRRRELGGNCAEGGRGQQEAGSVCRSPGEPPGPSQSGVHFSLTHTTFPFT